MSSASSLGYKASQQSHRIPFTIEAWQEFGITNTKDAAGDGAAAASSSGTDATDEVCYQCQCRSICFCSYLLALTLLVASAAYSSYHLWLVYAVEAS